MHDVGDRSALRRGRAFRPRPSGSRAGADRACATTSNGRSAQRRARGPTPGEPIVAGDRAWSSHWAVVEERGGTAHLPRRSDSRLSLLRLGDVTVKTAHDYCDPTGGEPADIRALAPVVGLEGERIRWAHRVLVLAASKDRSSAPLDARWITTHGYALNVGLDPSPFTEWITACAAEDTAFTTMAASWAGRLCRGRAAARGRIWLAFELRAAATGSGRSRSASSPGSPPRRAAPRISPESIRAGEAYGAAQVAASRRALRRPRGAILRWLALASGPPQPRPAHDLRGGALPCTSRGWGR